MEKMHKELLREGGKAAAKTEKNLKKALVKKEPIESLQADQAGWT